MRRNFYTDMPLQNEVTCQRILSWFLVEKFYILSIIFYDDLLNDISGSRVDIAEASPDISNGNRFPGR